MSENRSSRRFKRQSLLIVALFALPIVAAYVLYKMDWRPSGTTNYGQLIHPARPLPDVKLIKADGKVFDISELKGKWTLLYAGSAVCPEPCTTSLYKMRQIHILQAKNQHRVQRMMLVTDIKGLNELQKMLAKEYPKMIVASAEEKTLKQLAPVIQGADRFSSQNHSIYIIDPLGNAMMQYDASADPKGILKDLRRLLRLSHVG